MTNDQQQLLRYHPNELDDIKVQGRGVLGVEWVGGVSEAAQLEGVQGATQVQLQSASVFRPFAVQVASPTLLSRCLLRPTKGTAAPELPN